MAISASTQGRDTGATPFSVRVTGWSWRQPVPLAIASLGVFLGLVVVVHTLSGVHQIFEGSDGVFGIGSHVRVDIVLSFVSAYTLCTGCIALAKASRQFDLLRPVLRMADGEWQAFRGRLFPNSRTVTLAAAIGVVAAIILQSLPYVLETGALVEESFHTVPFMVLLMALLSVQALITIRHSQVFYEVGRSHLDVDLLDLDPLSPFAATGLTNAAIWLIGSAIASLLVTLVSNLSVVALVITATVGMGVAGLILPSRGLHRYLRERERDELAIVRKQIASERDILLATTATTATADSTRLSRLPALLAYEARIESVREWPFDTSTLSRFGLFLLIPLASWIGGALVERMVDVALR